MNDLIVATRNGGKVAELGVLLCGVPVTLRSLAEAGVAGEVPETGTTFLANAVQKAEHVCALTGLPALADDSGICVDALGGAPGVLSARYGGPGLGDADRVERLLAALRHVPPAARQAQFVCVLALARPGRTTLTVEGRVAGYVAAAPRGAAGFGYDPIFELPDSGVTMAQLAVETKNDISHRGRAARAMAAVIRQLVDTGDW